MNVLSLFDGMSCTRIAMDRAGLPATNYFASEIDKHAMKVSAKNYPDIVQLGDITKWENWKLPKIDLLVAGFPCQAWSVAGKQKGDDDPRGALVHDLIALWDFLEDLNPDMYFLFENVKMKKEFIKYINDLFGVDPIEINSALVSAQNRKRLYWTNIPDIEQPQDKGIVLKDIIAWSRSTRYPKEGDSYVEQRFTDTGKANTLTTGDGCGSFSSKNLIFLGGIEKGRRLHDGKNDSRNFREGYRVYSTEGKSPSLTKNSKGGEATHSVLCGDRMDNYRKLTPGECEMLQTVPPGFTEGVSATQRYKMLGNGFTVDVIAHMLRNIKWP